MSDAFADFIDRTQAFYGQLAENNRKDWFEPRKAAWKADIEGPAKLLSDIMAEEISRLSGAPHKAKVFRIHRDVRFSKDKSPYKTMLALLWVPAEAETLAPAFYFGVEPDRTFVGCGLPGMAKDTLAAYRARVDTHGDALAQAIDESGATLSSFGPEPLKRVPKPYDPDHPHADLLKRKALILGMPLPDGWRDDGLVAALDARIEALLPVRKVLIGR